MQNEDAAGGNLTCKKVWIYPCHAGYFAASEPCFCAKTRLLYSHLRRCGGYHIMTHHDQKKSQPGWQKTLVPAESEENLFLVLKLNSSFPLSCHVVQANVSRYNHHPGWPCKVEFFRNNTGTPWNFSILNSKMEVWFKMMFLFNLGWFFRYFVFKAVLLATLFLLKCLGWWVPCSILQCVNDICLRRRESLQSSTFSVGLAAARATRLEGGEVTIFQTGLDNGHEWIIHVFEVLVLNKKSGSGLFSSSKCFKYLGWFYRNVWTKLRHWIFVAIINFLLGEHIDITPYPVSSLIFTSVVIWGGHSLSLDLKGIPLLNDHCNTSRDPAPTTSPKHDQLSIFFRFISFLSPKQNKKQKTHRNIARNIVWVLELQNCFWF